MKLGYLGPEGSYSYIIGQYYAPDGQMLAYKSFRQIIRAVEEGHISRGVLPIENSTEGAVTQGMDALMATVDSKIRDELILRVRHNFLANNQETEKIRYVLSHPQAIEQCREFFAQNYPEIALIPCESTSDACRITREKGKEYGAIANSWAAKNNGLQVIHNDIQDNQNNQTRFLIIGKGESHKTGRDKTSIAFSFHDDFPGSLYNILKIFADKGVNLTRIESRPTKTELGRYIFYIDFIGHKKEENISEMLKLIEKKTNKLKIFGSYPIGKVY